MNRTWNGFPPQRRTPGRIVLALSMAVACTACPQMGITRGAEMAASSTFDDRSYEQQAADEMTTGAIEKKILESAPDLASGVNIDVYDGRVMLTGTVGSSSDRGVALALTKSAADGGLVYDDIQVTEAGGLMDEAGDFAANKELAAALLAAEGLSSQSFDHRVVNSVAYVIGQAASEQEVETARSVALGTDGVDRAVLHIDVSEN